MNAPAHTFWLSFVKPFYKENAGAIVFVFTMMIGIVSTMDGAGMLAYHYSLVTAMLTSPVLFWLVLFIWFLYARKCAVFVVVVLRSPPFSFLHIINCLSRAKRFCLFLAVAAGLLLPLLAYALFIVYAGCHQGLYGPVLFVVIYLLVLCVASAAWQVSVLHNLQQEAEGLGWQNKVRKMAGLSAYPAVLIAFIAREQKAIWVGVKIYTCGVLYLIARYNSALQYDTLMAFLFFNFGIYANGVLVYLIRAFEETYLSFYRSLPVSTLQRLVHYLRLYFILLLPEFATALLLMPVHLHCTDAVSFSLCAYSLLLLMNSLTFLTDFSTKEYAIVLLGIFCVQYIALPIAGFGFLYLLFFCAAILLFFQSYHRFERNAQKDAG